MKDAIRTWLTEQFGADEALHAELYGQYAADMKTCLATLVAEAGTGDAAKLAATAHTMKGMALQMGDAETADLCKTLQTAGQAADLATCADILPRVRALVDAL